MASPTTETQHRLSARITGRVQGVGFRNFTLRNARDLDLTGWVRNEPDGSVRLEAEGSRDALGELHDAVQRGPHAARVENVEADWSTADDAFDVFEVRYR
jgi:acylphosphatase